MATAKSISTSAPENVPQGTAPVLPGGFDELAPDVDGWWAPAEPKGGDYSKSIVTGQILGLQRMEADDERWFYTVKLAAPAMAQIGRGEDAVHQMLTEGQIIAVGEKHRLRGLREYVEHKGYIHIVYLGKERRPMGRTLAKFKIGVKGKKAPFIKPSLSTTEEQF